MSNAGPRLGAIALALTLAAVVLFIASVVAFFWVGWTTDSGLMCEAPYSSGEEPMACSVYGLAPVLLGLASLCAVGAFLSFVGSAALNRSRTR